jgi:hypothetical protein
VAHEPAALHSYWRKPDQHLPAFRTSTWKDQEGRPGAHVHVDGLALTVADFVSGALNRQLQWYENGRHGVATLVLREDQCWHRTCRKRVLLAYKPRFQAVLPSTFRSPKRWRGMGQPMLGPRLLCLICATTHGPSEGFSPLAALIARERSATKAKAGQGSQPLIPTQWIPTLRSDRGSMFRSGSPFPRGEVPLA